MYKFLKVTWVFLVCFLLLAFITNASFADVESDYRIRIACISARESSIGQALYKFAELAEQKSNNKIKVEVFPDSALGTEREMLEMLREGSIEMSTSGAGSLVAYAPATGISELPYLFRTREEALKAVLHVWDKITGSAIPFNIRILAPIDGGVRIIASKKPIRSLEDMKGLKIRVPESKLFVELFRALGAIPTPVALGEIYLALQTGIVEAADGSSTQLSTLKHYEQTDYLIMTNHIIGEIWLNINEKFYQGLPEDIRKIVKEATEEAAAWQRAQAAGEEEKYFQTMIDYGLEEIVPDVKPFEDATASFRRKYVEEIGPEAVEIYEEIERFLAENRAE
jgi:tripartite ATP-independent transporter DctP family solute receptor